MPSNSGNMPIKISAIMLSGVGAALGGAAYLLRRIGPTIVAHAILNGVVLTLVLTGVTERLTT